MELIEDEILEAWGIEGHPAVRRDWRQDVSRRAAAGVFHLERAGVGALPGLAVVVLASAGVVDEVFVHLPGGDGVDIHRPVAVPLVKKIDRTRSPAGEI